MRTRAIGSTESDAWNHLNPELWGWLVVLHSCLCPRWLGRWSWWRWQSFVKGPRATTTRVAQVEDLGLSPPSRPDSQKKVLLSDWCPYPIVTVVDDMSSCCYLWDTQLPAPLSLGSLCKASFSLVLSTSSYDKRGTQGLGSWFCNPSNNECFEDSPA